MSDDLITSLRALAAARHDDLSIAVDAAIEIERQRAEIERLRADLVIQQGCCDGAAAQDAHIRQEREEHRVEVEGLRAGIERLKRDSDEARDESNLVQEPVAWRNKKWGYFTVSPFASELTDWEPLYTAQRPHQLRNALEGKP